MAYDTVRYDHRLLVIEAFKAEACTEDQTERFVENMCNIIDKDYLNGDLTDHQYQALYLELPK